MPNITRSALDALSLTNFPNNTSQQISPADLRDWLDNGIDSFVTQKDSSRLENVIYENQGSGLAAGASVNLALATGNYLHITGAFNGITSFGVVPAGGRFVLVFDGICTLTDSATLILPGGSDITTAAGDCAMLVSEGSGNWRMVGFFPISGGGGGGTVTSVTATTPLQSTGGTAPDISIPQANGTTDGFLDSADWATFNGKQDALTLTTSGTSGAATLTGSTLNIPNYATGGGGSGTVTSVDLTMPSAFAVSGNPITTSGILAVTGAGLASQYVRGDGTLANFPESTGGGSSVSYYLNGSVTQLTIAGATYYQMSKTPIFGAGTNFTRTSASGDGYIASFITDVNDPNILSIPGGNFNLEFYFNASSGGGSPAFYAEIYRYDGSALTLIASASTNPEGITNGTTVDAYFTSIGVPTTALALTDRLAVRIYVITSGRNITLHTEDNNLCQVITTISTGLTALNGLTAQVQTFATGTSGTDFAISSVTNTHTFNIPDASASARGLITTGNQTLAGIKTFGNGASAGEIRLLEPSGSGTNYVAIKAQAMSADYSLTLPVDDGVSGQVLQTNGSGDLSWINLPSASGVSRINTTTAGTAVTGTFALTKSLSVLIPANTFGAGSILECMAIFVRTAGNGNATYRLMINTSDSVTGATSLGTAGVVSNTVDVFGKFYRDLVITNSTTDTSLLFTASSAVSDFGVFTNTTSALSQLSINWTVDQYLIAAINLSVGSTSMYCRAISILQK